MLDISISIPDAEKFKVDMKKLNEIAKKASKATVSDIKSKAPVRIAKHTLSPKS